MKPLEQLWTYIRLAVSMSCCDVNIVMAIEQLYSDGIISKSRMFNDGAYYKLSNDKRKTMMRWQRRYVYQQDSCHYPIINHIIKASKNLK